MTASHPLVPRRVFLFVIPRHVSAEGSPRFARGDSLPLCLPEARQCRGIPRLTPQSDSRRACSKTFSLQPLSLVRPFKKAPYSVLPSVSEASLACARDGVPHLVRKGASGWHKKYAQSDSRSACPKTFLFSLQPLSLVDKRGDGVKILTN